MVCYDVYGHSVYFEDGTEIGNQMFDTLAVTSRRIGSENDPNELGYLLDDRKICSNDH